jgi:hypothetical protein
MAAGLVLSAWFWLPAMAEKPLVQSEVLLTGFFDYRRGFLAGGLLDAAVAGAGLPLLIAAVVGVIVALATRRRAAIVVGLAVLGAVPLLLLARAAQPVWEAVPLLRYVQPNRLVGPATLLLSVAGAGAAVGLAVALRGRALGPVVVLALALGLQGMPDARAVRELPDRERGAEPFETCGFGEYLPRTVEVRPPPGGPIVRMEHGDVLEATIRGATIRAVVDSPAPTRVTLRQLDFLGWSARLDGERVAHDHDREGRMVLDVPAGRHRLDVRLGHTPVRALASAASVAGWMIVVAFGLARLLARATRRLWEPEKVA